MEEGTSQSPGYPAGTIEPGDADPFQWDVREDCQVRQILDRIADKWSLLVIALLDNRRLRFTQLRREIDGVSQRCGRNRVRIRTVRLPSTTSRTCSARRGVTAKACQRWRPRSRVTQAWLPS